MTALVIELAGLKVFSNFQECRQVFNHSEGAVRGFKHKGSEFQHPIFAGVEFLNKLFVEFFEPFF